MDPGPSIKNAGHADRPIRFQAEAQWQSSVVCFSCGSVRGHSLGKMKSTEELQEKNRLNGSPVCVSRKVTSMCKVHGLRYLWHTLVACGELRWKDA